MDRKSYYALSKETLLTADMDVGMTPVDLEKQVLPEPLTLMRTVLKRARRQEFSDLSFVEPLRRLMRALESEGDLSTFGRHAARFDIQRSLRNLLRLDAAEEIDPALPARPIHRPLFITGLPRSGTTLLHDLLAQHPDVITPLSWQMMYPYPWPSRLGARLCRSWADGQLRLMSWLAPQLRELHPLSAQAPQECTDITAQVFQSLRFDTIYRVPSYQSWLKQYGHLGAYRFHRRFLQHLDAQNPGHRWVLKSPDHVFALNEIQSVYPDARIVFLHRDPVSVLASVARLTEVLRRPFVRTVDRFELGQQVCSAWVEGSNLMVDAARRSRSILHLQYIELVSDPLGTLARLCEHCSLPLDERIRRHMWQWLARLQHSQAHRRDYRLDAFGLDAHVLRHLYARYVETFRIEPEHPSDIHAFPDVLQSA
jgi:hypothetical protein